MGALISQAVTLDPEIAAALRAAVALPERGWEAGEIALTYDEFRHNLEIGLLENGVRVGTVQWQWRNPGTVMWTGLDTPADTGWLSHLSGTLPPVAAQMGFTQLTAPVITEKLAGLLPLTGLEVNESGVLAGDLGRRQSRFWSYLDFKAGRVPEPAWRRTIRGP